uniref:BRCT domain-containing protein n=1 Tax=Rhabditophanes sp. KR3021 TaxID=114890 RepID=A0AC35TQG6_9BILA
MKAVVFGAEVEKNEQVLAKVAELRGVGLKAGKINGDQADYDVVFDGTQTKEEMAAALGCGVGCVLFIEGDNIAEQIEALSTEGYQKIKEETGADVVCGVGEPQERVAEEDTASDEVKEEAPVDEEVAVVSEQAKDVTPVEEDKSVVTGESLEVGEVSEKLTETTL